MNTVAATSGWPTRDRALLIAEAIPAFRTGTELISPVVSGATSSESPSPKTITAGMGPTSASIGGTSDPSCYPLRDIGVVTCETSNYGGAGEEEYVWLNAINNPYHVVVLVLTAPGSAPGGYELRVVDHRRDG